MKPLRLVGFLALAAGACAPAQTAGPAARPAPTAAPMTTTPATGPEAGPPGGPAPGNWWLMDLTADRYPGISAERAYRELLGEKTPKQTVTVAILDSGVDDEHEDLRNVLWTNPREVAGNNRDDDGNGYVDDVHGWNFIGGPDGRNVEHDTYEVTRLYAGGQPIFEGANPDTLRGARLQEYRAWLAIRDDYQAQRQEFEQTVAQYRQIEAVVAAAMQTLRGAVGTDSLTPERVARIPASTPQLAQAKQVYANITQAGITLEDLRSGRENAEALLRYGMNPDFDPRPIVGDNYADPTERRYGNADVEGPDADHGTHVAGIVAAERGNGVGINGVAPPQAVRIMSVRTVPNGDERDKDVANAIRYAVDNGARVINMSFGKAYSPRKDVVDAAVRYAETKGVLLVHGSGNDAVNVDTAGNFPNRFITGGGEASNWIEVGASTFRTDSLAASFSNYSRTRVDVFAPGAHIYSTVPQSDYRALQGTSMASPVVAGVAAVLMAYYPELTVQQVKQIIMDSAQRFPGQQTPLPAGEGGRVPFADLSVSGGVVNLYNAVQMAERMTAGRR